MKQTLGALVQLAQARGESEVSAGSGQALILVVCSFTESGTGHTGVFLVDALDGEQPLYVGSTSLENHWFDDIESVMEQAIGTGIKKVVVDLSGVEWVRSKWIGGLWSLYFFLNKRGIQVLVASPSDQLILTFRVTKIDRAFEIVDTVEGAITRLLDDDLGGT